MSKNIPLEDAVYDKISGLYDLDQGMAEFYREDDLLMMKRNGQISEGLVYKGDNTFEGAMGWRKVKFELHGNGEIEAKISQGTRTLEGTKVLKYG